MLKKLFLLGLFLLCVSGLPAVAQCDPLLDPNCEEDPDDPEVPLDGGTTLLLSAAIAYGYRKLKRKEEL